MHRKHVLRYEAMANGLEGNPKKKYIPKLYYQMQYPDSVFKSTSKFVPWSSIADPGNKLYQNTAIDEYSR